MAEIININLSRGMTIQLTNGKFIKPEAGISLRLGPGDDPVAVAEQYTPILDYLFLKAQLALVAEAKFHSSQDGTYEDLVAALNQRLENTGVVTKYREDVHSGEDQG